MAKISDGVYTLGRLDVVVEHGVVKHAFADGQIYYPYKRVAPNKREYYRDYPKLATLRAGLHTGAWILR